MTLAPKPGIPDISPYVGGRAGVPGVAKIWKLSSNESPLGPSPGALAAIDQAKASLSLYPEGSAQLLRDAIGEVCGLPPDRIVASGDGSDALLTILANAYVQPGDEVIFSEHAFVVYKIATLANSGRPVIDPEKTTNSTIKVDVDAMLKAVTPRTRMLYIANPNNPTGSMLNRDPRIQRVYFYNWKASADPVSWDSGLVGADGVPRPAYNVLSNYLAVARARAAARARAQSAHH